jgi:hypothetical protein
VCVVAFGRYEHRIGCLGVLDCVGDGLVGGENEVAAARIGHPVALKPIRQSMAHLSKGVRGQRSSKYE